MVVLMPRVGFANTAAMKRRRFYLLAFAILVLIGGCAYERVAGRSVIDTLFETFVVNRRSAEDQREYYHDQFYNRD
jgi:hypothetical protein